MVVPEDRERFLNFIDALATKEQTLTLQYRIKHKDGRILYVRDTMTSKRLDDGHMYGFAVIADITQEHEAAAESDENFQSTPLLGSHGVLKCTCEKYPKVVYINDYMLEHLNVSGGSSTGWKEFIDENILFMIPIEERDKFQGYLDKALTTSEPIHIEHMLLRSDGLRIYAMGWLSVTKNFKGENEYTFIYMSAKNYEETSPGIQQNSYFNALKSAYNIIFEINLSTNTVECIHGRKTSAIGPLYDINMTIDSAINFWLNNYIIEEDIPVMKIFLENISSLPGAWEESPVIQTEFRINWMNGNQYHFLGVAVRLNTSTVLLCCRDISKISHTHIDSQESVALTKIENWLNCFYNVDSALVGAVFFEEKEGSYSLVYASKSVTDYMGMTRSSYLKRVTGSSTLEELERLLLPLSRVEFAKLLEDGSLTTMIPKGRATSTGTDKISIRLSSTSRKIDDKILHRILLYDAEHQTEVDNTSASRIFARTFGHFDLFVDGISVAFSSDKEKELMALLIDRHGGTLSTREAISYLWEGEEVSERVSSRYRKLAMGLKNTLKKYNIEHILINNRGVRSINISAITCDYYELLAGNQHYIDAFQNVYLSDYSWSEETLATLWDYS
jgi:hypothetical protein